MKMKDIVKEDFDDLKLGKVGAELDDPERGMGKSFKGDSMFDQLGKIIDTQGGADPLKTVVTDDGETIEVDPNQAAELRKLLRGNWGQITGLPDDIQTISTPHVRMILRMTKGRPLFSDLKNQCIAKLKTLINRLQL